MNKLTVIIFIIALISCSSNDHKDKIVEVDVVIEETDDTVSSNPNADYQFLFIGNSLTDTNNLPKLVEIKYNELGISIGTTSLTPPGYGLEDHWNVGLIQPLIRSNYYDYVIIQQGPSSQEYGRTSLIEYGGKIAALCNANDTQLAFFMVWPSRTNYNTFDGVIANYTTAAQSSNAILCPVGRLWKYHFDNSLDFSYYGTDGFHPSLAGSANAAQIIVQYLGL